MNDIQGEREGKDIWYKDIIRRDRCYAGLNTGGTNRFAFIFQFSCDVEVFPHYYNNNIIIIQ